MGFIPTFTQTIIPSNIRAFAPLVKHNNTNNVTLFIDNTFKLGVLNTGASPSISYDNTNKYFDLFTGNTTTYLLSNMNLRPTPTPTQTITPTPSPPPISEISIGPGSDINLLTEFTNRYGAPTSPRTVIFRAVGNIYSTSTSTFALQTGSWPAGSKITLNINSGVIIAGRGGQGASGRGGGGGGGPAVYIEYNDVTVNNNGTIGGGGGGGAGGATPFRCCGNMCGAPGGGGGGYGSGGSNCLGTGGTGDIYSGGAAVNTGWGKGGNGGSLGSAGGSAPHDASHTNYGGPPGASIVKASGIAYVLNNSGTIIPSP